MHTEYAGSSLEGTWGLERHPRVQPEQAVPGTASHHVYALTTFSDV